MEQVIITPEAVKVLDIDRIVSFTITELKSGDPTAWRSVIFLEGISNAQIADILKPILLSVDAPFGIFTRVSPAGIHVLAGDNEIRDKYLDIE